MALSMDAFVEDLFVLMVLDVPNLAATSLRTWKMMLFTSSKKSPDQPIRIEDDSAREEEGF